MPQIRKAGIVILIVCVVALGGAAIWFWSGSQKGGREAVNPSPPPAIALPSQKPAEPVKVPSQSKEREVRQVTDLTKDNFQEFVKSSLPVVIDFWAPWCSYCRMLMPIYEEVAKELSGKMKFGRVNVDDEEELASRFKVQGIPLLVILQDGKEVKRLVGYRPKDQLLKELQPYIK